MRSDSRKSNAPPSLVTRPPATGLSPAGIIRCARNVLCARSVMEEASEGREDRTLPTHFDVWRDLVAYSAVSALSCSTLDGPNECPRMVK